ncbi:hypothetical protein TREMEDRAFT_25459 [Tremella mesenterica DSM 1558]|uniref:uncharacterized protein n=1 Tax=Tremella mesenterica (strain ATCC 24925 / CBS 8224 / DSM 1558 / NBRC 9311 / NRRL Y-6157 / RJB 2259-6 / UBC 559-6) TaxID=578456 RepID=UPI0003F4998E|nr:uncharacterized protein TREMEDRAFT_25459 [Tremella mesenterica DSM 1558]EIW71913.1 hypothetical protein TREMEDRAFT_25459 [Tremella mesenterica DSM 1558]
MTLSSDTSKLILEQEEEEQEKEEKEEKEEKGYSQGYQDSSQYLHWRYSSEQLYTIRYELNMKCAEKIKTNQRLEREAQLSLGHDLTPYTEPPRLNVTDELVLIRFYSSQISQICRKGFGLPEMVENTAITYLKRFYLKNSVMDWHPKNIMPTCLFLAAKTTNHPIPIDIFVPKFAKLSPGDIFDTEFLVAQSLSFQFWIRGPEKALRGFGLDFQTLPNPEPISSTLSKAAHYLSQSRLTDLEFFYTPSQIALSCWSLSSPSLVDKWLDEKYDSLSTLSIQSSSTHHDPSDSSLKEVDKRLKGNMNPEKIPGTAL